MILSLITAMSPSSRVWKGTENIKIVFLMEPLVATLLAVICSFPRLGN